MYHYSVKPHFEGIEKAKLIRHLKYSCNVLIQNGGPKRVWISTQNNGHVNGGF